MLTVAALNGGYAQDSLQAINEWMLECTDCKKWVCGLNVQKKIRLNCVVALSTTMI
jgi:Tfp pilus assembly major pilin PilA